MTETHAWYTRFLNRLLARRMLWDEVDKPLQSCHSAPIKGDSDAIEKITD